MKTNTLKNNLGLIIMLFICTLGCQKDNYKFPSSSLQGMIVDQATGEAVPLQIINGGALQLFQTDLVENSTSINSSFHADGSYTNTLLFDGNYRIVVNGPFLYSDTLRVAIIGDTNMNIPVLPYLQIDSEIVQVTANKITIRVRPVASDSNKNTKIARIAAVIGTTNSLDINFYGQRMLTNTEQIPNPNLLTQWQEYTFEGLTPATTYYIRGAARTINTGNFYNYTLPLIINTLAN